MPIILLPIVSYVILGPLEIYFGNKKDFAFCFTDFFGIFLIIAVLTWLVLSLLAALLPEKIKKEIMTLIAGFGVASYLQNMLMNIRYGEYAGITKLDRNFAQLMKNEMEAMVEEGNYNQWYEYVLVQLIFKNEFQLYYKDIADYDWTEVDCVSDLLHAKNIHMREK